MNVQSVSFAPGNLLAKTPYCSVGACGSQSLLTNEIRKCAFDRNHPAQCLGFSRREAVMHADDVLLIRVAGTIEKRGLDTRNVMQPSAGENGHMARLKPFVAADHGNKRIAPVTPRHFIPRQGLFPGQSLRLQHKGAPRFF